MNKKDIIIELKLVFDPEMPSIDVFNLGLIYDIDIKEDKVTITHTLTSMLCPAAGEISNNIKEAAERVAGEGNVKVILTHTPPFTQEMLSEEAKLILNL
jgi:metal-sulfur cluster biosynthetic enzyme|tara:strand:+ start:6751 stop:7047 length:297 start_codon:yes stop_codon:yes gene_type:complete